MGYVATEFSLVGTEIFIEVREKSIKAKVVALPFYKEKILAFIYKHNLPGILCVSIGSNILENFQVS